MYLGADVCCFRRTRTGERYLEPTHDKIRKGAAYKCLVEEVLGDAEATLKVKSIN